MCMTNVNVKSIRPLPSFNELKRDYPLTEKAKATVVSARESVSAILKGENQSQHLLIVGPCSVHDYEETLAYARQLMELQQKYGDRFLFLMRVCCDKPRTKKDWRGFFNDPDLDGTCDMDKGFRYARQLMLAINELGLPVACEALSDKSFNVVSDLVSYAWIGARTVTSPDVRDLATGLSMPVGIKNSNADDHFDSALNAIEFALHPSVFAGPDDDGKISCVRTSGNPQPHLILRGGKSGPNYDLKHIRRASAELRASHLPERLIVDCSHGNAKGDEKNQIDVLVYLAHKLAAGERAIAGFMLESYLSGGKQDKETCKLLGTQEGASRVKPGLSVTDSCLSFADTTKLIEQVYLFLK